MAKLLFSILIALFLGCAQINGNLDNSLGSGSGGPRQTAEEMIEKSHLIRHVSTTKCLVLDKPTGQVHNGVLWDCFDRINNDLESELYVLVKTNGGGYLIMGYAGSADNCLFAGIEYYDPVISHKCDPDNANLSWFPRKIDGTTDMYQLVQKSSGRCLRAPGQKNGVEIRAGDCDVNDSEQSWHICKYDGTCNF